ncbi:hypothetical protein BDV06DRAFT_233630 [Aspergillus oleicola]
MENSPRRVVIYALVTDIPGIPERRFTTLGEMFCEQILGRGLDRAVKPSSYDFVHIPPDFDSEDPIKRWFIMDLNVREELSREDVQHLPHLVYLASWQQGHMKFIERRNWTESAARKASTYMWGGRQEQRSVAPMRQRNSAHES